MKFDVKPLPFDPKKIKGLSEKLLVSHYDNNYTGAVKRLNAIVEQLAGLDYAKAPGFLVNAWAADHTTTLAAGQPILVLDMYEHAYHMDYGAKAAAYVDVFMKTIHWENAMKQYDRVSGES